MTSSIKRYLPKYKKLLKLKCLLWEEKSSKILKFKRRKWVENFWRFRKKKTLKLIHQDRSFFSRPSFYTDPKGQFRKIQKPYRFFLGNKQRLQIFYGAGRLKYSQLKSLSRKALELADKKKINPALTMFYFLENRLQILLYRFGFVFSLTEAKRLVQSGHIKIAEKFEKNFSYKLKKSDILCLNPIMYEKIIPLFLLRNSLIQGFPKNKIWVPLKGFLIRNRAHRRIELEKKKLKSSFIIFIRRKRFFLNSIVLNNFLSFFSITKEKIKLFKHFKKHYERKKMFQLLQKRKLFYLASSSPKFFLTDFSIHNGVDSKFKNLLTKLSFSNLLALKKAFYVFQKFFKKLKRKNLKLKSRASLNELDFFSNLQKISGNLFSQSEKKKTINFQLLQVLTLKYFLFFELSKNYQINQLIGFSPKKPVFFDSKLSYKNKNIKEVPKLVSKVKKSK